MKELTVRFTDHTAEYVSLTAKSMGLTSEELVKTIVGKWMKDDCTENVMTLIASGLSSAIRGISEKELTDLVKSHNKRILRERGGKCWNCGLPLKIEDIDSGTCSNCKADIFDKEGRYGSLDNDIPR